MRPDNFRKLFSINTLVNACGLADATALDAFRQLARQILETLTSARPMEVAILPPLFTTLIEHWSSDGLRTS
jgi:hypothetical protein